MINKENIDKKIFDAAIRMLNEKKKRKTSIENLKNVMGNKQSIPWPFVYECGSYSCFYSLVIDNEFNLLEIKE